MGVNHNCCYLKLQTFDPFEEIFYRILILKYSFIKLTLLRLKHKSRPSVLRKCIKKCERVILFVFLSFKNP